MPNTTSFLPEYNFEIGSLYFQQGDYIQAEKKLSPACSAFYERRDFTKYTDTLNILLRIYAEWEDFSKIQAEKEKLQDLVVKGQLKLGAMTYYILGLCSVYRPDGCSTSMEYFQKALQSALEHENKVHMCWSIYGLAAAYYGMDDLDNCLKELSNLDVFFGVVNVPDLQVSSKLLAASTYRQRGQHEKAFEFYWKAYELLRTHKNMFLYLYALYGLGATYLRSGDNTHAKLYLDLAIRTTDEKQFPRLMKLIRENLSLLGERDSADFDLVYEQKTNGVIEKARGAVNFKNQFILLDLLQLFMKNPGKVFPKEILVRKVWNEEYDPSIHDNKIYVTIKRLRKMIEPDFDKPKYIFRAKNGYYLNKNTRVLVSQ